MYTDFLLTLLVILGLVGLELKRRQLKKEGVLL
jgi:hypothetical protein